MAGYGSDGDGYSRGGTDASGGPIPLLRDMFKEVVEEVTGPVLHERIRVWVGLAMAPLQVGMQKLSGELCRVLQDSSKMHGICEQLLEISYKQVRQVEAMKAQISVVQAQMEEHCRKNMPDNAGLDGGAKKTPGGGSKEKKDKGKRESKGKGKKKNKQKESCVIA